MCKQISPIFQLASNVSERLSETKATDLARGVIDVRKFPESTSLDAAHITSPHRKPES
jgi:hypothetical protein